MPDGWGFRTARGFLPRQQLRGRTVNLICKNGTRFERVTVYMHGEDDLLLNGGHVRLFGTGEPEPIASETLQVREIVSGELVS